MSSIEKTLEASFPSAELEHQAAMFTVTIDYKEAFLPERSLCDFSQNTICFTEVRNSLHGSKLSLDDEIEIQEASDSTPSIVENDSKTPQKNIFLNLILQSPQKTNTLFSPILHF